MQLTKVKRLHLLFFFLVFPPMYVRVYCYYVESLVVLDFVSSVTLVFQETFSVGEIRF